MSNLWEEAGKPDTTVARVLTAASADPNVRKPRDLTGCLACLKRWNLLEQLRDDPVYGKEARGELALKACHDWDAARVTARVATYPPMIRAMHGVLQRALGPGIYDVIYPSSRAHKVGLGDNYMALTGDGLFLFAVEVMDLDDPDGGTFRLVHIPPESTYFPKDFEDPTAARFRDLTGLAYGDTASGNQVLKGLCRTFGVKTID